MVERVTAQDLEGGMRAEAGQAEAGQAEPGRPGSERAETGPAESGRPGSERAEAGQLEAEGRLVRWAVEPADPRGLRYLSQGGGRWAGTPRADGPATGLAYASFAARAVAFAIDIAVIAVVFQLLSAIVGAVEIGVGPSEDGLTRLVLLQDAVLVVLVVGGFAWAWSVLGCSPGQLVAGLRTLRLSDGRRLPPLAAGGRAVLLLVPWLLLSMGPALPQLLAGPVLGASGPSPNALWLLLAGAVIVWYGLLAWSTLEDPRGRGWHDTVAGSAVVGAGE
ncbi:MAG: RDD family protein [Candidatus Limnocylindrales bacterium]